MTKRQLADHVLRLADKTARAEIRRLKAQMQRDARDGVRLFNKYSFCGIGPTVEGGFRGLPHEIEDFLQSVGGGRD